MSEELPRRLIVPEENYFYTQTHEWITLDDKNTITVGITNFAQDSLGEIVSWKLPKEGQSFAKGAMLGLIESNKSVSDIYMPVTGEVVEINSNLAPGLISEYPMSKGWLVRVEIIKESELSSLLDAESYRKWIQEEIKKME